MDHVENARTGPSAWDRDAPAARVLGNDDASRLSAGSAPAPAELGVVHLITEHDIEAHEELAGDGHFGLGPAAAMQDGEVATPKIVVRAGAKEAACPSTQRRSAFPCFVILPRCCLSAEALMAGAKPT